MDPVTTAIVAAIVSGTTGAVLQGPIHDAYERLKALIRKRFPGTSDAINEAEKEPASAGRKLVLSEKITAAGADRDTAVLSAAEELMKLLEETPGGRQSIQNARGSYIAQASENSQAAVNVNQPPKPQK